MVSMVVSIYEISQKVQILGLTDRHSLWRNMKTSSLQMSQINDSRTPSSTGGGGSTTFVKSTESSERFDSDDLSEGTKPLRGSCKELFMLEDPEAEECGPRF